jgi:hypothetical protein
MRAMLWISLVVLICAPIRFTSGDGSPVAVEFARAAAQAGCGATNCR